MRLLIQLVIGLIAVTVDSLVPTSAAGDLIRFQSGTKQVSLVELYTSEGCCSCPPAEAWVNRLKDSPDLWKVFTPVAFHVDYWNSLGWIDRWSQPEFAGRQRDYARLWRAENIYTPEWVLNGKEWRGWSSRQDAPPASSLVTGMLEIYSTNGHLWNVSFTPAMEGKDGYEIHAALLAGGLISAVKAGENRGRTLPHEFAVIDLVQFGLTTSAAGAHGKFILNLAAHSSEKELALAAWVTRKGELEPLQSTGGWLMPAARVAK